jgi:hypothetical protein
MKNITEFLKTSLVGGLFVLLPLILFYLLLAELLQVVVLLATPIANLFPKGTFDRLNTPVLMALILIVMERRRLYETYGNVVCLGDHVFRRRGHGSGQTAAERC